MFEFESMREKERALYECMWGSPEFDFNDFPVKKNISGDDRVLNSYSFSGTSTVDKDICRERLADIFQITNRALFNEEKFEQSISGDGDELKSIATLHSSSLCALLFFYNVTEENPYIMEIEREKYEFTYSRFEYKNPVIAGRKASNMDVVLVGRNKNTNVPVIFFLESKFSEYYMGVGKKLKNIAAAYLTNEHSGPIYRSDYLTNEYSGPIYRSDCLADMGLDIEVQPDASKFSLVSKNDEYVYLHGIKQMISHYVGVRNFCDNQAAKNRIIAEALSGEVSGEVKILLGEILFTKGIGELPIGSGKSCLASYQEKYRILAKELNRQIGIAGISKQLTVLSDILSYSQFQRSSCIKEERVKRFYFALNS